MSTCGTADQPAVENVFFKDSPPHGLYMVDVLNFSAQESSSVPFKYAARSSSSALW